MNTGARMNIVLVNIWLDPERGTGTAERTRQLARSFAELGCRCSLVTMGPTPWRDEFTAAGIRVHSIGCFGRTYPIPLLRPIELWRVVRGADVIHVMGYWYFLAAAVCLVARLACKPLVICPAGELLAFDPRELLKRLYHRLIGRHMIAGAASIIAITARERDQLIQSFRVDPSRIVTFPNGISTSQAPESGTLRSPAESFVLFVGRLATVKAPDLLVEAFAAVGDAFPQVHLVMVGPDFGMRSGLDKRIRELGIAERVHFLGFIDEGHRQYLYRRAALLVVPSRSEVMSVVALEAAAVGTPVLLTDRCGFDEIAEIGGGLVVAADQQALAEGLRVMLSDQAALRHMGERLRRFALERYTWPIVARRMLDHFASLIPATNLPRFR